MKSLLGQQVGPSHLASSAADHGVIPMMNIKEGFQVDEPNVFIPYGRRVYFFAS